MDPRRLSTTEFLQSGLINMPAPGTLVPKGMTLHNVYLDENEITPDYIRTLLEKGDGIESAQDYGCWAIWKARNGYDAELMQYRRRTGEFHGMSLDEAVNQAYEWYRRMEGYDEWD